MKSVNVGRTIAGLVMLGGAATGFIGTAAAHSPDRVYNTLPAILEHLLEPDHLAAILGAIIAAALAYRWIRARNAKMGGGD